MVTNPINQNEDLDRKAHNAFVIGLLITVSSGLIVIGTLILQATTGENYYAWVTAVGTIGGIVSMILGKRGKPLGAGVVVITSLFIIAAFYVVAFETIASMMAIIIIILSLGIAVQTIPAEKLTRAVIIIVLIGAGLIILDQFWPVDRTPPPLYSETIIFVAGIATILALAFIVIKQFPTFSLRGKLIGATLAVAIIAVAVVAIGVSYMTTNAITQEVGTNLNTHANAQALTSGEYLARIMTGIGTLTANKTIQDSVVARNATYEGSEEEIIEELESIDEIWATSSEDDPFIQSILKNDVSEEFKKYQTIFPDAFEVIAVDKYGGLIAATEQPDDFYEGEEEWFLDAYSNGFGSTYISNPVYDSEENDWLIYVGIPIHTSTEGGGGEISGVIRAAVHIEALGNLLAFGAFGETGHIEMYFPFDLEAETDDIGDLLPADLQKEIDEGILAGEIDEDNIILSLTSDESGEYDVHIADLLPGIEMLFNDASIDYFLGDHHGAENIVSGADVTTLAHAPAVDWLDWIIIALQESDESLQPVADQQKLNTILGLIVIVSAGAVAYYVGTSLSQPISKLTKTAEQVAQGDLSIQAEIESQDEIGILANAFNDMTGQLRDSITTLEQRVQSRTQALATTVEVGRQLSTILDEEELITAVVTQVRDSFDYYQAQIYLLENDGKTLRMASGTGEAGQQMLADQHKLQIGTGLVGRAADINQVILVSDVASDKNWIPNPLLPDTKSETAVPITIGDEVLGVLDVQHNIINGLQQEDTDLLQSIANQIAVALRNARLYQETQQRAQNEALLRDINQKITSTTDMETAMKVAIRELGDALKTKQTVVHLGHQKPENRN